MITIDAETFDRSTAHAVHSGDVHFVWMTDGSGQPRLFDSTETAADAEHLAEVLRGVPDGAFLEISADGCRDLCHDGRVIARLAAPDDYTREPITTNPRGSTGAMNNTTDNRRAAIEQERERRAQRFGDATGALPPDAPDGGVIAEGRMNTMAAHGVAEAFDDAGGDDADNGDNDDDGELRERFDDRQ